MRTSFLFFLLPFVSLIALEDIDGFWKTVNEEGVAQCVIAVYEYDDAHYGRIIGSYDDNGKMNDTIYNPKKRAPGVVGQRFYSGLDIIWGLVNSGMKFKGKILDPQKGNIYNSELWVNKNGNLVVRGKYLVFGRSQEWLPASESDFPEGFKIPDLAELVPDIPQVQK
ncbi:MAG TPA: DUF2147 domain-containing protein [Chlamydiales bacterium]|nr:DUF2147 domain-containing protein [Chlamydiales bacterium]